MLKHESDNSKESRKTRKLRRRSRAEYKQAELERDVMRIGEDIVNSERFKKALQVRHHVKFNIAVHSLETAAFALRIARWLNRRGFSVDEENVVRASLLHDIGMTENPVFLSPSYKKAFSHPKEGRRIAESEFNANKEQLDAIRRHMWPIGIVPPKHMTGWIVLAADKLSSMREAKRVARQKAEIKRRKLQKLKYTKEEKK